MRTRPGIHVDVVAGGCVEVGEDVDGKVSEEDAGGKVDVRLLI